MDDVRAIRVKNLRDLSKKEGGISALAKKIGRSQPYVSSRIGKNPSAYIGHAAARDIEQIFGLAPYYLDVPHGESDNAESYVQARRIPMLSDIDVVEYVSDPLAFDESKYIQTINSPAEHSPRAFAIRMAGDSMVSNTVHSFPESTILYLEPGMQPKPGRFALIDVDGYIEFRQLVSQFGKWLAKPLNPAYPAIEIDNEEQILGICVATAMLFDL